MEIAQLDKFFDVIQYQLRDQAAIVRLVDGSIEVRASYLFFNEEGREVGRVNHLNMMVTSVQSDDLRTILATILQATNAAIEEQTGWTRRSD